MLTMIRLSWHNQLENIYARLMFASMLQSRQSTLGPIKVNKKRFSVFISSTFVDLREERQAVQDAVLSAGDFPVQMETFPAADTDQMKFIEALIDQCDYYVLIIAGRYGTVGPDGLIFTEKEYRYAKKRGIPILVMLRSEIDDLPASKTERFAEGRERLEAFIGEASNGRLRKNWANVGELKHVVRDALDHAKATRPGIGWIRGDAAASSDILNEINGLRKDNDRLKSIVGDLEVELSYPPLPAFTEKMLIQMVPCKFMKTRTGTFTGTYACIETTWQNLFPLFYGSLAWGVNQWSGRSTYAIDTEESVRSLAARLAEELGYHGLGGLYQVSTNDFEKLVDYFTEIGLMNADDERPFSEAGIKFARRHRIASDHGMQMTVVKGSIGKGFVDEKGDPMDDEIPF